MAFGLLRLGRYVAKVPARGRLGVLVRRRRDDGHPPTPDPPRPARPRAATPRPTRWASSWTVLAQLGQARREPMILGAIVILGALRDRRRLWPRLPVELAGRGAGDPRRPATRLARAGRWLDLADWPPLASFAWGPSDLVDVLPTAFGLAVVVSVNVLITSRVVEHFRGRHRPLRAADADAELGAYGIANLFAGAFGAPPSVGIPARSLANVRCGGPDPALEPVPRRRPAAAGPVRLGPDRRRSRWRRWRE